MRYVTSANVDLKNEIYFVRKFYVHDYSMFRSYLIKS